MTANTKSIRQVAFRNNEGAALLVCGKFAQAFQSFEKTAEELAAIIKSYPSKTISPTNTSSRRLDEAAPESPFLPGDTPYQYASVTVPRFDQNQFYVYGRAMIIISPENILCDSPISMLTSALSFCSAIITFNMAIALHLTGKLSRDGNSLKMAMELYEASIFYSGSNLMHYCHTSMLVIASLNNIAHIHYNLDATREAQMVFDHMLCILEICNPFISSSYDRKQIGKMVLNFLLWRKPTIAPSA